MGIQIKFHPKMGILEIFNSKSKFSKFSLYLRVMIHEKFIDIISKINEAT